MVTGPFSQDFKLIRWQFRHRRRYRTHKHKKGGKKKKIHTVFDSESEEELEEEDYTNMQIPVLEDALTNRP